MYLVVRHLGSCDVVAVTFGQHFADLQSLQAPGARYCLLRLRTASLVQYQDSNRSLFLPGKLRPGYMPFRLSGNKCGYAIRWLYCATLMHQNNGEAYSSL